MPRQKTRYAVQSRVDADIKTKLNESKLGESKMIEYILKAYYESENVKFYVEKYYLKTNSNEKKI